jgi:hypothetical protein
MGWLSFACNDAQCTHSHMVQAETHELKDHRTTSCDVPMARLRTPSDGLQRVRSGCGCGPRTARATASGPREKDPLWPVPLASGSGALSAAARACGSGGALEAQRQAARCACARQRGRGRLSKGSTSAGADARQDRRRLVGWAVGGGYSAAGKQRGNAWGQHGTAQNNGDSDHRTHEATQVCEYGSDLFRGRAIHLDGNPTDDATGSAAATTADGQSMSAHLSARER